MTNVAQDRGLKGKYIAYNFYMLCFILAMFCVVDSYGTSLCALSTVAISSQILENKLTYSKAFKAPLRHSKLVHFNVSY